MGADQNLTVRRLKTIPASLILTTRQHAAPPGGHPAGVEDSQGRFPLGVSGSVMDSAPINRQCGLFDGLTERRVGMAGAGDIFSRSPEL